MSRSSSIRFTFFVKLINVYFFFPFQRWLNHEWKKSARMMLQNFEKTFWILQMMKSRSSHWYTKQIRRVWKKTQVISSKEIQTEKSPDYKDPRRFQTAPYLMEYLLFKNVFGLWFTKNKILYYKLAFLVMNKKLTHIYKMLHTYLLLYHV